MDDLISRADAIRIAEQGQVKGYEWQFKKLVLLPSAQKTGRWIPRQSECGIKGDMVYICDQCGNNVGRYPKDFCTYCGSYNKKG